MPEEFVSYESLNQLNKDNYAEINVVENNVSKAQFCKVIYFTVKTAYLNLLSTIALPD